MATELKTKLVIEAQAQGSDNIERLADEIEQLAASGGDVAPKFHLLAAELHALAQQQALVDRFKELKAQTEGFARTAAAAGQATKEAALALKQKQAALAQAQAGEKALANQLEAARGAHAQIGQAIASARQELRELGQASKQAGSDTALLKERMQDARGQIKALQGSYREAGAHVKTLTLAQREAAAAMRTAGREAKQAQASFDAQRRGARQSNQQWQQSAQALQRLRDEMAQAGISSRDLAAAQTRIHQQMQQVQTRAGELGRAYRTAGDAAAESAATQIRTHRNVGEGVRSISKELGLMRNMYLGLQGVLGAAHSLKGLIDTADAMAGVQARIKLVTGDGALFAQTWERIGQVALETSSNLEASAELFTSLARAGTDAGLSTAQAAEQSLELVRIINQAVQVSGASAAASEAAVRQLIQGLQSGVLRGDEFNSVMEQAPRLARALADGLGVTTGELRKMAEAGQITAETVIQALQSQAQVLEQEFGQMPQTIGSALENLGTAWSKLVASFNESSGGGALLASAIDLVADNLQTLAHVALSAGVALAAITAAKTLGGLTTLAAAALSSTRGLSAMAASADHASAAIERTAAAKQRFASIARGIAYVAIADQLLQIASAYMQIRQQQRLQAQAEENIAQLEERKAQRLREISQSTGVLVASMQELHDAQEKGLLLFDEATGKWQSAAQAQEQLAQASQKSAHQLAQTHAAQAIGEYERLAQAAEQSAQKIEGAAARAEAFAQATGQALQKLLDNLKVDDAASVGALVQALDRLRERGAITAEQFGQAWRQALDKLDAQQVRQFLASVQSAAAQGIITAREAATINAQVLNDAFARLGVNAAQALGQISEGAQKAIDAVDKIAAAAKNVGLGVNEAAQAIEMAFTAAVPKADSLQAIEALEKRLKAAGAAGEIGAEGISRVQAALDKQRATIEQQLPGIQSLEEALKQLGVTPQAELERLAQSAKEAFEAVKNSGQATPREINEAWKKMAEAAIAANDGVADASLKAAAQQHGFAIETDKAGKSIIKSMEEAKEATEGVGQAAEKSGDKMAEAAKKAKDAWADGSLVEQAEKHNAAVGKIEGSWIRADVAASQYARQMAEVVWEQGKAIAQMSEEHARLVAQMEALAEQQRHLDAVNNDAVKGLENLRLRYLELTGDQEAAAELKMQMARQEIDLKLALLEIDLQRAQIAGDTAEVKKFELQIAALKEQLTWLDKIHAKEKELRKEREREERSHGRSSGGGGSGSSSAGSLPPPTPTPAPQPAPPAPPAPPVNITLHAHGITDPVRLAKAIEPELARLARLAR